MAKYRSGFEGKAAESLRKQGAPVVYEKTKIKYTIPQSNHTYTPDFDLSGWHLECKGLFSSRDRAKLVLVKAQHPKKIIRILFMRDNYINKGSKTKYSDWARKNGFEYHVSSKGEVPKEWLK